MELKGLKTNFLGRNMTFYKTIDSTQKKIRSLKHPIDGTLIIADSQFEAVGTHDRRWYTGNGKNIAMSFVLIPERNIKDIQGITINTARCMIKSIKKLYKIEIDLKEPNDLYLNGKKIGGVLTETVCKGEIIKKIYVGIGFNVNQEEFPGTLSEIATSLKKEFNQEFDREKIIVEFLNKFEKIYLKVLKI